MEKEKNISNRTAVRFENPQLVSLEKLSGLTTRRVKVRDIYHFDLIPDSNEPSRFNVPVLVQDEEEFACLDNYSMVESTFEEAILSIVFTIGDTSDAGIALFKTMLKMTGIGGKLNFAEQVRNVRMLFDMYQNQDGLITRKSGGDRRSGSFKGQEGLKIQKFLADQLDKSEGTIQKYLELTSYLSTDSLIELGKQRATKRHYAYISSRRIDFIKGADPEWSEEKIQEEVSKRVVTEWLAEYDPNKQAAKPKQIETSKPDVASQTTNPPGNEAEEAKDQKENSSKGVPNEENPEEPTSEEINNESQETAPDVDKEASEGEDGSGDDDDSTDEVEEGDPVITQLNQKVSIADKKTRVVELGNNLVRIGQGEPDPETFAAEIGKIIFELMKLIPNNSKASTSLNTQVLGNG